MSEGVDDSGGAVCTSLAALVMKKPWQSARMELKAASGTITRTRM
jgi:hypothetical protein